MPDSEAGVSPLFTKVEKGVNICNAIAHSLIRSLPSEHLDQESERTPTRRLLPLALQLTASKFC
ncbi:MAG TPA: hypothetical protein V6C91_20710 [Coleofasciculaceae cyanobacterium]